jgi:hypothetical protein
VNPLEVGALLCHNSTWLGWVVSESKSTPLIDWFVVSYVVAAIVEQKLCSGAAVRFHLKSGKNGHLASFHHMSLCKLEAEELCPVNFET